MQQRLLCSMEYRLRLHSNRRGRIRQVFFCMKVREKWISKHPVGEVGQSWCGVGHCVVGYFDISNRGINLLAPSQQGEVLHNGAYRHVRVDAASIGPPLQCRVIHGCEDVGQGLHLGGKNMDLQYQNCYFHIFDHHVPFGVTVNKNSGLHLLWKWGVPLKILTFWVSADSSHACARGVYWANTVRGKGVKLLQGCGSVFHICDKTAPSAQIIMYWKR